MKMYYTSNYGDVNLEQVENNVKLKTTSLTLLEEKLIKQLLTKYEDKISDLEDSDSSLENKEFTIQNTMLSDVHKVMTKTLKKDKPILTALKFKDGKIEVTEELKNKDAEAAITGVTVERPRRHCPVPSLMETEFLSSQVLKEFLTNQQLKDFEVHRQIVCKGNYSGKNYLITSRWSPKIKLYGSIYDLATNELICANCKELPPSEEILSLKLILEFREREFLSDIL